MLASAQDVVRRAMINGFSVPPKVTVSKWADEFRRVGSSSPEHGSWDTSRAEYQRGIMDAEADKRVHQIVVVAGTQTGKTEVLLNTQGKRIDRNPGPMMMVQPSIDLSRSWSRQRFQPMVDLSPVLKSKVSTNVSRDSGNTILEKNFLGGDLAIVGANAPSGLRSRPRRDLYLDEIDAYPASAGREGDPVMLAKARQDNFWNRFTMMASSPTIKGFSRIWEEFDLSDQRYFFVSFPCCGASQRLVWKQVRWEDSKPETAKYECEHCGEQHGDVTRHRAVKAGEWIATAPFNGIAGFHISRLYSPWTALSKLVSDFLAAKSHPEKLKVFVNTNLAELWEDEGSKVEEEHLRDRVRSYGPNSLPSGVALATAGVDVQDDRLEVEIVGWGKSDSAWGILYAVLYGNPAENEVWSELRDLLLATYEREDGAEIRVSATCVDTGGHHPNDVYNFCRRNRRYKVHAIKGGSGQSTNAKPIWPSRHSRSKNKEMLFIVGTYAAKDMIYGRWGLQHDGAGSWYVPDDPDAGYDDNWFAGATVERKVTRYTKGRPFQEWVNPPGARNESLDCRVYALAALKSMGPKAKKLADGDMLTAPVKAKKKPKSNRNRESFL